jgi:hypothetical protein
MQRNLLQNALSVCQNCATQIDALSQQKAEARQCFRRHAIKRSTADLPALASSNATPGLFPHGKFSGC